MWFGRLFGRKKEPPEGERKATIGQGIFYLYLIIGLQVLFVFALMTVIITMGKVLATPLWMFIAAFATGVAGCVFIYRKAKEQFRRFRETIQRTDLTDRNYEISFMGGVLTMRVEQNPRRLLENNPSPVIDTDSVESTAAR